MRITYKIQPDLEGLAKKYTGDPRGIRRAGMIHIVTEVEARAKKNAPVKTSNLASSGTSDVNADGSRGTVSFTAPYAGYVHQGTGIYGPHKKRLVSAQEAVIVPKNAKALFWPGASHPVKMVRTTKALYWPGMKHPVHSTKGMKGRPFLLKAAEESDMEKLFVEGAENFLERKGGSN